MITTIMAAFAFGYCISDMVINYINHRHVQKLLEETIHD
jgi:hypothetical protein